MLMWMVMVVASTASATEVRIEELRDGLERATASGPVTVVAVASTARSMRAVAYQVGDSVVVRRTGGVPSDPHTRFGDGSYCTVVVERTTDKDRFEVSSHGPCGPDAIDAGWADLTPVQQPESGIGPIAVGDPALEDPERKLFGVDEQGTVRGTTTAIGLAGHTAVDTRFGQAQPGRFILAGRVQQVEERRGWPTEQELTIAWSALDTERDVVAVQGLTTGYLVHDGQMRPGDAMQVLVERSALDFLTDPSVADALSGTGETVRLAEPVSQLGRAELTVDTEFRDRVSRSMRTASTLGNLERVGAVVMAAAGGALVFESYSKATDDRDFYYTNEWRGIQVRNMTGWALIAASPVVFWDGSRRAAHPRGERP